MTPGPLHALCALGQSLWLDDLGRGLLESGTLRRLVRDDGVSGVTSNPAIFDKAIASGAYAARMRTAARRGAAAGAVYEALALADVREAADLLAPVHCASDGADGFVSLEVSPQLADDTAGTIAEARRLWRALDRPNVMIKVPATDAGLPAIRALLADGINVNVTLLFGLGRYARVAAAFQSALEDRLGAGRPAGAVASVASFFLSRIDTAVDARLQALGTPPALALRGRTAIALARLAHAHYREWTASPRWRALAGQGARPQRLLWASTSTKDPAYPDLKYVEPLIGPDTVTTLPLATLEAYRDHGRPAPRLGDELAEACALPPQLAALGIELAPLAVQLEREGVRKFVEPFVALKRRIETELRAAAG